MSIAYCFASGEIGIAHGYDGVPPGAISFMRGPIQPLKKEIAVAARHAYDGQTLLVPGIPEAEDQTEAALALCKWLDWRGKNLVPSLRILPAVAMLRADLEYNGHLNKIKKEISQ